MSTLLESRQHHRRIRTQSRRAQEAHIYQNEYSDVQHDTAVVERQCAQRTRRDRERQNRVVEELGSSGTVCYL